LPIERKRKKVVTRVGKDLEGALGKVLWDENRTSIKKGISGREARRFYGLEERSEIKGEK